MYQIYCNGSLLWENSNDDLILTEAALELELGKSGSLTFTIYPDHPSYDSVVQMAPVQVSRNYEKIYGGRILDIKIGFYGQKQVSCEGELAFLLDSAIPPHSYTGDFSGYLEYVLGMHNRLVDADKQFVKGNVTVGDFSPFTASEKAEYRSAWDTLQSKMVAPSGGYLSIRYDASLGMNCVDLLAYEGAASDVSGQSIELGKNLLDISRESSGASLYSAIVPLGAKLEGSEQRLDIRSVNSGLPYIINQAAVELCKGVIYRQVVFDNITNAETLKTYAESYLADNYAGEYSIEITAADLSGTDANIDHFRVGKWVRVYNEHHFGHTPQLFQIKKMAVDLLQAAVNKVVIGTVKKGLTDDMASLSKGVDSISVPEAVQPYVIESGSTGIWTWKKFSDNTCEFFGKIPVTSADVTGALGGWYKGANLYDATAYEYPVSMAEAPVVEMMFQTRNGLGALIWVFSQDAETAQKYLPQSYLIRPTTATGIHGNISIVGKGKL